MRSVLFGLKLMHVTFYRCFETLLSSININDFLHEKEKNEALNFSFAKCAATSNPTANVIYCITCTLCHKLNIGETGRRPGDRFR